MEGFCFHPGILPESLRAQIKFTFLYTPITIEETGDVSKIIISEFYLSSHGIALKFIRSSSKLYHRFLGPSRIYDLCNRINYEGSTVISWVVITDYSVK